MRRAIIALGLLAALAGPAAAQNPRLIVVSDIGNEPDDCESFVRLLAYTNQIDLKGLIAATSTWQRDAIHPELFRERIDGYAKVLKNLRAHDKAYPDAEALRAVVKNGQPHYGVAYVGDGFDTDGSNLIIAEADKPDPRPLWIVNWGGSVDLAQALYRVRASRTPDQVKAFVAKLRVYSISDQDDAGPWARMNFPDLFWIASINAFNQYGSATWTGISSDSYGDPHGEHPAGPDTRLITNEWIDANIRKGPLGALYPHWKYQMEGDTPSFLNLAARGLADPEHPEWGGWGGRYGKVAPQYGLYSNANDTAEGVDGKPYSSNQATIWRWRQAYQNDFAARIGWTLTPDFHRANHAPNAVLNGDHSLAPLRIDARYGEPVRLSADGSADPDHNRLTYKWWVYQEASSPGVTAQLTFPQATQATLRVAPPAPFPGLGAVREIHVILEVWDDGAPTLVAYRRAVVTVRP
jgi:hypothetical protein